MGGLTASIRLAQLGYAVTVFEARSSAGGLASSFEAGSLRFDAGPYVLLDRPGLDWAFQRLGLDLRSENPLIRIEELYDVRFGGRREGSDLRGPSSDRGSDGEELARQCEALPRIRRGARKSPSQRAPTSIRRHTRLAFACSHRRRPTGFRFLCVGCASALRRSGLASEIVDALSIWDAHCRAISRRGPESSRLGARPHSHRRRFRSSWRDRCHSLAAGRKKQKRWA